MQKRILIVEDEKPLARALELKLGHLGYQSQEVSDGSAALDALREGGYALVLLDLIMPKMNGFEVLEAMRKRKDKTPVIVLTNLGQSEDRKRVMDLGAKDFFIKSDTPISVVMNKISSMLS